MATDNNNNNNRPTLSIDLGGLPPNRVTATARTASDSLHTLRDAMCTMGSSVASLSQAFSITPSVRSFMSQDLPDNTAYRIVIRNCGIPRSILRSLEGDRRIVNMRLEVGQQIGQHINGNTVTIVCRGSVMLATVQDAVAEHGGDMSVDADSSPDRNINDLGEIERIVAANIATQTDNRAIATLLGEDITRASVSAGNDGVINREEIRSRRHRELPSGRIMIMVEPLGSEPFELRLTARAINSERYHMRRENLTTVNITAELRTNEDRLQGRMGGFQETDILQEAVLDALQAMFNGGVESGAPTYRGVDPAKEPEQEWDDTPQTKKRIIDLD